MKTDMPPLATYKAIRDYVPAYSDFVVWCGWLTTWHGVVSNYNQETNEVSIIFSTLPFLLFTMDVDKQNAETRQIKLSKLRSSPNGVFAICQHDFANNATIWYI